MIDIDNNYSGNQIRVITKLLNINANNIRNLRRKQSEMLNQYVMVSTFDVWLYMTYVDTIITYYLWMLF